LKKLLERLEQFVNWKWFSSRCPSV